MQADGDDIRFAGATCENLAYWVQDGINTTTTNIWVKIPSLPNGTTVIRMLYGNGSVTSSDQASDVFGSGIAALYSFTEGSGTTLHDWVGGNDLTLTSLTWGSGERTGIGSLTGFTGGGRAYRADNGVAIGTGSFTAFATINPTNPNGSTNGIVGNYYDDGTNGWVLKLQGGTGQFMLLTNQGGNWCQQGSGSLAASTWASVGAVRSSGVTNSLYQNGNHLINLCSGDARNVTNSGPFEIGRGYNGGYPFNGSISLVAIYTSALNSTQMAALNASLRPATHPTISYGSETTPGTTPTITQNPTSNTAVCSGGSVAFTANASGYSFVWWELSTDGGGTWNPIPGATSTTYTINPTTLAQNGHQFRAAFASAGCAVQRTTAATLNLHGAPSMNVAFNTSSIVYRPGKMRTIVAYLTGISGQCGPFATRLVSITANEAILATDIQFASYGTTPADVNFNVHSTRNTGVTPRIYTVTYRVTDASGNSTDVARTVTVPLVGGLKPALPEDETDAVAGVAMLENAPNPFSGETEIRYLIAGAGRVSLSVFDASGRLVTTLVDDTRDAGLHFERWNGQTADGTPVAPGTYFARLVTPTDSRTIPLHVVR